MTTTIMHVWAIRPHMWNKWQICFRMGGLELLGEAHGATRKEAVKDLRRRGYTVPRELEREGRRQAC